ncbi:MAG: pentapeptide repeat-containing protein [Rubrobacteraceae bacterium]
MADDSEHGKLSREIKRALDLARARAVKLAHNAEWVFGRRTARVLGVVAFFAVVVALLLVFLNWYVAPTEPSEKKDLVLALAQILAGTALLSGLYFTWRTMQVNREGQITERFTRAIDQLGSKELEIRLGGIYALERIATDSERDHRPIMEVLSAFVRQHAPRAPQDGSGEVEDPHHKHRLAPDIQAILTVLGRRSSTSQSGWIVGGPRGWIDVDREVEQIDLHSTDLRGAYLAETDLRVANLQEVDLQEANLLRANLWAANLRGADLRRARLEFTNLSGAFLKGANLQAATLAGAELRLAELDEMKLQQAILVGADLWSAQLWGANLSGANLGAAKLHGAHLEGTVGLTQEQIDEAHGDEITELPNGLRRPDSWIVQTNE